MSKNSLKARLSRLPYINHFRIGRGLVNSQEFRHARQSIKMESAKAPQRTEVINFLLSLYRRQTNYLEIGVRNPADNFDLIQADVKFSVDPGVEFEGNPVDFKMTSDEFFEKLSAGVILKSDLLFDVVFIDGLHLAEQADRDIRNALEVLSEDGFVVVHDCNPPTVWNARENYDFLHSPAGRFWNGTTWKAFVKWRSNPSVFSCCVDSDWGIGIISKKHNIGSNIELANEFFEYDDFAARRAHYLNLVTFGELKDALGS